MDCVEQILLFIYFPHFQSRKQSRFESFFISIKDNKKLVNKTNKTKIYPEKIVRNEDKRTSVIIKGIPIDLPKNEIRNLMNKYGNINYLYIIKSYIKEENNTSMAFVNFINYKSIIPLFMSLRNYKIEKNGKLYNLKIMYSNAQGKENLKEYLKKNNYFKNVNNNKYIWGNVRNNKGKDIIYLSIKYKYVNIEYFLFIKKLFDE